MCCAAPVRTLGNSLCDYAKGATSRECRGLTLAHVQASPSRSLSLVKQAVPHCIAALLLEEAAMFVARCAVSPPAPSPKFS